MQYSFNVKVELEHGSTMTFNTTACDEREAQANVVAHLEECGIEFTRILYVVRGRYDPED